MTELLVNRRDSLQVIGPEAELRFGRRDFLGMTTVFTGARRSPI